MKRKRRIGVNGKEKEKNARRNKEVNARRKQGKRMQGGNKEVGKFNEEKRRENNKK